MSRPDCEATAHRPPTESSPGRVTVELFFSPAYLADLVRPADTVGPDLVWSVICWLFLNHERDL
jgi:hypothetical protein